MTNTNLELNFTAIKCPHCGAEYLPCEIFYPKHLLGVPENIIKDPLGKILYVEWRENYAADLTESFVCDQCNHSFVVSANISYKAEKEAEILDFGCVETSLF